MIVYCLAILMAFSGASNDPMMRFYKDSVPVLTMVSSKHQVSSALLDDEWYGEGKKINGSDYSVVSIDSEQAIVVLDNGTDKRTVRLWD